MNQEKIGAFIAGCRREKGMTQSQLAEELGITNKAVSKWETGRSMPDLSLFEPLSVLLGITINELLAGERIPEEKLKEKTEAVLKDVLAKWLGQDQQESGEVFGEQENVLRVEKLSKVYAVEGRGRAAVRDVSFQVRRGSFVGIMGASGCGKTTLLNLIATIDRPTGGTVRVKGQDITSLSEGEKAKFRREHLGFVFQEYNLVENMTVYENMALALTLKGVPGRKIREKILRLSGKLSIDSVLDKFPYEVSGGQRQRCACARAVLAEPDLILADEPTGALDSYGARELLDVFSMMCRDYGATILMVTHDVMSASYCDRIFFMQDGSMKAFLNRRTESRQEFFTKILEKMAWMEGGCSYVS